MNENTNIAAAFPVEPTVIHGRWQDENKWKTSRITILQNADSNAVLLAAVDWKNYQSLENQQALYMAILKMLGEHPENIHMLDGEG